MFKRRNPKSYWRLIKEGFVPESGWRRAISYMALRLKRLPDTPHKVALGFAAGAFVTFSPFFGLHFFMAAIVAFIVRGNVLASLIGTFIGNPITFPFIGAISYRLGLYLMGYTKEETAWDKIRNGFSEAFDTLWTNLKSLAGYPPSSWDGFLEFWNSVIVPYTIGGLAPGFVTAVAVYFITKPLIKAYQNRRKGRLLAKFNEIREKRAKKAEESAASE